MPSDRLAVVWVLGTELNPASQDFGEIAGVVERDRGQDGRVGAQVDAERAEPEVGHVYLEQGRRVTGDFNPGGRHVMEEAVAAQAGDGEEDGDRQPHRHRQDGDLQGDPGALQKTG